MTFGGHGVGTFLFSKLKHVSSQVDPVLSQVTFLWVSVCVCVCVCVSLCVRAHAPRVSYSTRIIIVAGSVIPLVFCH